MEFDTNRGPTANQLAIVITELNVVTCPTYHEKFMRDNVVAPSVPNFGCHCHAVTCLVSAAMTTASHASR